MSDEPSSGVLTNRQRIAWLARYWVGHGAMAALLVGLTLVASAVAIAYPLVFRDVIDGAKSGRIENAELFPLLWALAAIVGGRLIAGFYPAFRAWMNLIIEKAVRERLFDAILDKDHRFFGRFRTGDLVTRLTDDISEYPRIAWFGCSGVFRFLDSFTRFVLCVTAMLWLDTELALLAMAPVPLMLYVFYLARTRLTETSKLQQEEVSRTNNAIESALAGIRIVKAFNADEGQQHRLSEILERRVGVQFKLARLVVLVHELDHVVARIGQVIVLSVGGLRVLDGDMTLGTLVALYVFLEMLLQPMMDLPNVFVTARQAFVSIDRVDEVIQFPAVARRTGNGAAPETFDGVRLDGVGFAYAPDVAPSLTDVTFDIPRGRTVAVVGPVGSGKSTLLRLLAGLVPSQRGVYAPGGTPFGDWDWTELRTRIGYVPQESTLFSESVEENVVFGRPADEAWTAECLAVAQMTDEVAAMPDGLASEIGRRGTLVSGGQKQRIAIARALAGRPQLLLLDDCVASLDARNEDRLWTDLERVCPDVTTFVVSHRLATVRRADSILVMDGGRLIDHGSHDELVDRCATYRDCLLTEERRSHLDEA